MKKDSNSLKKSEPPMKRKNLRVAERRDSSEVMAELVSQLRQQLEVKSVAVVEAGRDEGDAVSPNLDRLTVGVDIGDQWSNYCILGLGGETLAEGQFRTRRQEVGEFFQGLAMSRVVFEVGTHSAWVREMIAGLGHEVLVANARRMEDQSGAGVRTTGSMPPSWPGWGVWIRNRCIRFNIAAPKSARTCW